MINIKEILNKIGINSNETKEMYLSSIKEVTQEHIDLLDPDKIDCREFWRLASEIDSDSILGKCDMEKTIENINGMNFALAYYSGSTNYITKHVKSILEIGAGYGCFYKNGGYDYDYTGIDVVPRFDKVIETDGNGIPQELLDKTYDCVYSCNVFQHLSLKQTNQYIEDSYKVLKDGGTLIIATCLLSNKNQYCFTLGQFIPLLTFFDFSDILEKNNFEIIQTNVRHSDNFTCFICTKKRC